MPFHPGCVSLAALPLTRPPTSNVLMFPKPMPERFPNTFECAALPLVKPTGFRGYGAGWFFGLEFNLTGVQVDGV